MTTELELEQRLAEISEELKNLVAEVGQHLAEKGDRDEEQHTSMCRALENMGTEIAQALKKTGGSDLVDAIVNGLKNALSVHPAIHLTADVNVSSAVVKVEQQNVELDVTVKPNVSIQPVFKVPAPEVRIERATWNDLDVTFKYEGARMTGARFKRIS